MPQITHENEIERNRESLNLFHFAIFESNNAKTTCRSKGGYVETVKISTKIATFLATFICANET